MFIDTFPQKNVTLLGQYVLDCIGGIGGILLFSPIGFPCDAHITLFFFSLSLSLNISSILLTVQGINRIQLLTCTISMNSQMPCCLPIPVVRIWPSGTLAPKTTQSK